MVHVNIKLPTIEAVQEFVETVSYFDEDISLSSGKYIVDAKSIMGIFSLDLRVPISMDIDAEEADDILNAVRKFIVE